MPAPADAPRVSVAAFDLAPGGDDGVDCVVYPDSLLFRPGEYSDKEFSMTPEELRAAVEAFAGPVPCELEHINTEGIATFIDGQLGTVESVRLTPEGELRGTVKIPRDVDRIWGRYLARTGGTARRVSCVWDRAAKTLRGLGLVIRGRVPGAALFAAFADAQSEPDPNEPPAAERPSPAPRPKGKPMNLRERTKAMLGPDATDEDVEAYLDELKAELKPPVAETEEEEVETEAATTVPASFADSPEGRAALDRIAELERENRTARFRAEAAAFAADNKGRLLPAERENAVNFLVAARLSEAEAVADDRRPAVVTFGEGGKQKNLSLADAFKAFVAARPPLDLTRDVLDDSEKQGTRALAQFSGDPDEADPAKDAAEVDRLLSLIPEGRLVLAERNGKGK